MEGQVFIRCRKDDQAVIESVIDEAVNTYREMLISQVVRFKGRSADEIPCNIIFDTKYLESHDDNQTTGSIGGFKMYAKKGRIVCS